MTSTMSTGHKLRNQKGVVLIIVLLFMLALSTIAIFSARNVTLGERQARNELEYQVARQAAEAALRDAERDLRLDAGLPKPTDATCARNESVLRTDDVVISASEFTETCLKGQCMLPASRYSVAWTAATPANGASGATPGEPWWPESKGGLWGDDFFKSLFPYTASNSNCSAFTGAVPMGLFTGAAPISGVSRQPEYLIEHLSNPMQDPTVSGKNFECPTPLLNTTAGLESADATAGTTAGQIQNLPCLLFRITARGYGPTENAQVIVQTYFHRIKP